MSALRCVAECRVPCENRRPGETCHPPKVPVAADAPHVNAAPPLAATATGTCPWLPCNSVGCAEFGSPQCPGHVAADERVNSAVKESLRPQDDPYAEVMEWSQP